MSSQPIEIAALLAELGFDTAEGTALAREALEEAKLTREGKSRIDGAKRPRVEELLEATFLVTCGSPACAREAGARIAVPSAAPSNCRICAGSPNKRSLQGAATAFKKAGIRRVVVVGGSPSVHDELRLTVPREWELRLVDGTGRRTLDQARADLKWADVVLLWGSSELDHKVSTLYLTQGRERVVHATRRGIAALFDEAAEHARRR